MNQSVNKLILQVSYEKQPEGAIPLSGFLFFCNGRFIQQQPVVNNTLEFNIKDKAAALKRSISPQELRVFIVPARDKGIQNVSSISELENYKPYEAILNMDAEGDYSILPIPTSVSHFWPFCNCRVTGKVAKWFQVGNGWINRPVCKARVHICEVDAIRYWIYRIPDYIIAKIPEAILNPNELIKWSPASPAPVPLPYSSSSTRSETLTGILQKRPPIFNTTSAEEKQAEALSKLPELSVDIKQNLASGNLNLIRETIVDHYTLLTPWFCLWPWWWPYFYRCIELATVYTDANGRFDTNVSYWCWGDKPDIYIWVEYLINGIWTTVYRPAVPCYTLWNYACGTNINIQITDPRVPGNCCCDCPLPGELVWIRSVGSTSAAHINQQSIVQPPAGQMTGYDRIGLTDASAIYDGFLVTTSGDYKRPFGASPSLYMGFGSDLPKTGIYYYRWSYKQVKNAQLFPVSDTYKPLLPINGSMNKGYEYTYIDSHGVEQFGANSVKLGPFTVGGNDNLYIIPPVQPNMAPFNVPESNPLWWEQTYNMNTMYFDSSALTGGDGLYEFQLELFDQSGNLLTGIPKITFKIPDYNNPDFSVDAPDILLENPTAAHANAFNMLIRIDNAVCNAAIFTVKVNGAPASSDCCGFVKYAPGGVEADLELSFLATHPDNFAVFSFNVDKGTCGDVALADASGMVIDSTYVSLNPTIIYSYQLNSGVYDKHFTPAQLLGNCYSDGTGKAAFAETLSVIAMATDGTYRVRAHDALYQVAAFALEPS